MVPGDVHRSLIAGWTDGRIKETLNVEQQKQQISEVTTERSIHSFILYERRCLIFKVSVH